MTVQEAFAAQIQHDYPKKVLLSSGKAVMLRPLQGGDDAALLALFRGIPVKERGRFFRDDVVDPKAVADWIQNASAGHNITLVALDGDRLIAHGALLREGLYMKSHVAQLRLTVDPKVRGGGLGRAMVTELLDLAPALGLGWVDTELYTIETPALGLVKSLGFRQVGLLPDHGRDALGVKFDVVVLTRETSPTSTVDIGGEG